MEEELIRGDTAIIEFSIEEDLSLEDIDTLILTAREYFEGPILFSKNKEDFKFENKVFSVEILPEDTQDLEIKKFNFDIELTLNDGTRNSLIGKIELIRDYTTHKSGGADNEN